MSKSTEKSNAVAVVEQITSLSVAEGTDKSDVRGKENIDSNDVTLPRLAVVQALSPQKDDSNAAYIPDIKEGDLFNSLTGTNYGRGPVSFVVVRVDKRALEFDADRNIVDFNVPWNDARCEFTTGPDGTRLKPKASRFYDVIALLPDTLEPVVLSMSNTKIKTAKKLNSLLAIRPGAAWAGLYKVSAVREEKNGNKYWNFKVDPAGPTPVAVQRAAEQLYSQFAKQTVRVDQGEAEGDGEALPF